jgi:hypothetical protein
MSQATRESEQGPSVVDRELQALASHRAALRGADLPPPNEAPKGTFLHGFFLPFSLILATARDRELRGPYLRVVGVRGLIVALCGVVAILGGSVQGRAAKRDRPNGIVVHKSIDSTKPSEPVHIDWPGLKVNLDAQKEEAEVSVLGQQLPVKTIDDNLPSPPEPTAAIDRVTQTARTSWTWILALFTTLSALELIVVFFSRRWDDWLSFHASSRLAAILPEDAMPRTPKLGFDLGWVYRKVKRRVRGYGVFASGLPLMLVLREIPIAGPWLFTVLATLWGWYWLGVFSAGKSAHAWADGAQAVPPAPIRVLTARTPRSVLFAPLRWYGRLWMRITRTFDPAVTTFERSPAAFLGLALARVILSLPGVYLFARPIIPVAAGRLCAEADPDARFSIESMPF